MPIDVEAALAADLGVHAPPVPSDLGGALPYCVAERVGGGRADLVVDTHYVAFDVWARTWDGAQAEAADLLARAMALPRDPHARHGWCAVTADALPYDNPDPDRPDLARATFQLSITCRAEARDLLTL